MTWLLASLLTGFVLRFIASEVMHIKSDLDWRWELAATVLWPIALVLGMIVRLHKRGRPMELIVMRLADMKRIHPDQITATCARCGHTVAVYPSGQAVMRQHPDVKLMCQVCRQPGDEAALLAPGAEFEPFQSVKKQ
jgi:hypothetical protein